MRRTTLPRRTKHACRDLNKTSIVRVFEPLGGGTIMADWTGAIFPPTSADLNHRSPQQRALCGCPFHAIMSAVAMVCPDQIFEMILDDLVMPRNVEAVLKTENSRGQIDERLFCASRLIIVHFQNGRGVPISSLLYSYDPNTVEHVFNLSVLRDGSLDSDGFGWLSLIEKAYVVKRALDQDYNNLDGCNHSKVVPSVQQYLLDLVGSFQETSTANQQRVNTMLRRCRRRATIATTPKDHGSHRFHGLTPDHTMVVERFHRNNVTLWDSLGGENILTLREFRQATDFMFQADQHSVCGVL